MQIKKILLSKIETNKGQIPGLPQNPRTIKDYRYKKLLQSLRELPSMMELREVIVFPHNEKFIVIGGNMRVIGCKELKWKEVPCKVLDPETSIDILKEISIKDNNAFGEDDLQLLSEEWDAKELESWGLEMPEIDNEDEEPQPPTEKGNLKHQKQIRLTYSEKDYKRAIKMLAEIAETPEEAVWILLKAHPKAK